MRRLVFRAWNPDKKCWVDLNRNNLYLKQDPDCRGSWILLERKGSSIYWHDNLIFMQHTGLYDDDGKEIIEGDVVYAYKNNTHLEGYYSVVWDAKRGRWAYKNGNILEKYQVGKAGNIHCVIQGNIFEDIELKYIAKR